MPLTGCVINGAAPRHHGHGYGYGYGYGYGKKYGYGAKPSSQGKYHAFTGYNSSK